MKYAVLTMADQSRQAHVDMQLAGLKRWAPNTPHYHAPLGEDRNLARARNHAATMALEGGAELLIFLDADCIPGPFLIKRYVEEARQWPGEILCGPVTYLGPPGPEGYDLDELERLTNPHPARPNLPADESRHGTEEEWNLFWSLSFALSAATWLESGGFDENYVGYGAEDTDFAYRLHTQGRNLRWVGGAHAYHQWHAVSSPPVEHLDDILANATRFHTTWDTWPMQGWLTQFQEMGLVDYRAGRWVKR
ncbi:galactosyltransferase-related protein [uncultured Corynebacterium sp.]|uniref:galactosyltransferase-related protein n=1 Tax=uncultured Corynebacterium sp. TaxID=159447 RepID=UPI0025CE4713|nr:galactosyltransferase-related protein [uncultured Corynebacterium sp.]